MTTQSEMTYRSLGRCGTKVSTFGLGGWTTLGESVSGGDEVRSIITAARDAGVNFFDIADVYANGESERAMGKVLGEFPRHELVISSKLFFPMSDDINDRGLSRKHIVESIEKSLKRIGTDYLDIYFCHRFDEETPLEETARAMDDLIRAGKVLYWGTSEWTGDKLRTAHAVCDLRNLHRPQVEQPQYNLLERGRFEKKVQQSVDELGMGVVVWSPLASGLLTGKHDGGIAKGSRLERIGWLRKQVHAEEKIVKVRAFKAIADEMGCSRTQLALAWVAGRANVSSVILGASSVEQLQENLAAMAIQPSAQILAKLDELFSPDQAGE